MFLTNTISAKNTQKANMMHKLKQIMAVTALATAIAGSAAMAAVDFTGPWEIATTIKSLKTVDGKAPPLTAEGKKMQAENLKGKDPMAQCLPPGIPRIMLQTGYVFNFVVGQDTGGMFFEWNRQPRPIWIGNEHFDNIGPTYLGQSVAKWDGDTLVLDTNGFNDVTWLDDSGLPHTDELHLVERIRLKDANTLEDRMTVTDPKVFSKPWTTVLTFNKRPGYIVKEDWCVGRMRAAKAATGK
jgi:hypothetical protein